MSDNLSAQIEAMLFYHGEPIEKTKLADICDARLEDIQKALAELKSGLDQRGLALVENESTVQLRTDTAFGKLITEFRTNEVDTNLTDPQAEALSVIAYMQPVTKPDIDFIRGVNSRTVLRNLQTRGLIQKSKQANNAIYKLTSEALAHLGITNTEELPQYQSTRDKLTEFTTAAQKKESNQQS